MALLQPTFAAPTRSFPPTLRRPLARAILALPLWLSALMALGSLTWVVSRSFTLDMLPGDRPGDPPVSLPDSGLSPTGPSALPPQDSLSHAFTPEVLLWEKEILRWAGQYNLDPNLVATVMQIESCGHPSIRSYAGAAGLFQVMPFHFSPAEDPTDVETNARRAMPYLAGALALANGRIDLAFAGYNGGHGVIPRDPRLWAPETQRYVRWGSGIMADIASGKVPSPTLTDWLNAGGERLCHQAATVLARAP